jgi:hypothetical protein
LWNKLFIYSFFFVIRAFKSIFMKNIFLFVCLSICLSVCILFFNLRSSNFFKNYLRTNSTAGFLDPLPGSSGIEVGLGHFFIEILHYISKKIHYSISRWIFLIFKISFFFCANFSNLLQNVYILCVCEHARTSNMCKGSDIFKTNPVKADVQ